MIIDILTYTVEVLAILFAIPILAGAFALWDSGHKRPLIGRQSARGKARRL